ncbi:thioesterase domain-containing protein [Methylocella sp. CPCC 101449]|uniref:thioesterase domain-containing protein n=1 Tax=Methylocella sp. CPCC 101449 TaxID=2987531 RepID=UPI0028905700|nr:thioesterase domain-containing protein [Methylocella sp. CPCC 101449]MDT2021269.1 thioesterase domain-containing protein [Methylocella sp. CPCC 101449]
MNAVRPPIIVLPGASGHAPDGALFSADAADRDRVVALRYPPWQNHVDAGLSGEALVETLTAEILRRAPQMPVVLVGVSIGGHFAHATALRLESLGHGVAGLCIIDAGTITAARSAQWKARLTSHALDLLRRGRPGALALHARHLAWRGLFRLAGDGLPALARGHAAPLHRIGMIDPTFAEELSMRLRIRMAATWMGSLDDHPAVLRAPTVLLRTRVTTSADSLWRRRCPDLRIIDIPGNHETLFEPKNAAALRTAFLAASVNWTR